MLKQEKNKSNAWYHNRHDSDYWPSEKERRLILSLARATVYPSFWALFLPYIVFDRARVLIAALTHLATVEVLESGSERPIHVVILSGETVLSVVAERVEFVAPMPVEVEPFSWGVGTGG